MQYSRASFDVRFKQRQYNSWTTMTYYCSVTVLYIVYGHAPTYTIVLQ